MYRVFLVDDEIVIREGIRNHFLWEASDFTLAGEAPDGEVALEMLKDIQPDILLTDIRMPFMDGLTLVKLAKESMPWLHVIILSGYDDFAYARQALELGVSDYLLKPVSAEELLAALEKVTARIERDRRARADVRALQEQFASNSQFLKEKAVQDLFRPGLDDAEIARIETRAHRLGIALRAHCYAAMVVKPAEAREEDELLLEAHLRRLASASGGTVHFCESLGDAIFWVLGDSDGDLDGRLYGLAQAVRRELQDATGIKTRICLGKTVHGLKDAYESLRQARRVSKRPDLQPIAGPEDMPDSPGLSLAELNVLPIRQQLQFLTRRDVETVLNRYIESLGEAALRSMMMASYAYVEITLAASKIVRDCGGDPAEVLPRYSGESPGQTASVEEIRPMLGEILLAAVGFREERGKSRHDALIAKAQAYLAEKFCDPMVNLRELAEHVNLSTNHFCTVFSQATGKTFTEYLTDLRMEKAKELLANAALRTSDVAYQVGFNDPHYFSYLFRKHEGVSPRDYRAAGK
ncbi:MAG: response regulator [Oscillospiraceae bacterium]|jgi:two-component system response regulator YesN|nr:response regulator [Oscillospiraceae bacterium]